MFIVNRCAMCKENGEKIVRLLLHCLMVRELWTFIFEVFGVKCVMP